jgi:lipopolysaccharide export system protein LptC
MIKSSVKAARFTLSELMLASAILLVAILGLVSLLMNCIFINEFNNHLVTAVNDAQYVLEQIKNLSYNQIGYYTSNFDPSHFSNLKQEEITFPTVNLGTDITEVKVKVRWTERGHDTNTELSTLIAK